jgi:hypothetical protein
MKRIRFTKTNIALLVLVAALLFVHHQTLISCPAILSSPYGAVYGAVNGFLYKLVGYDVENLNMNKTLYHEWDLLDARIWPKEKINSVCYHFSIKSPDNRGIGIFVTGDNVLEVDLPPSLTLEERKYYSKQEKTYPFEERVSLYIDGNLVSNSTKYTRIPGLTAMLIPNAAPDTTVGSLYNITWYPDLSFGKHIAKIVVKTLPGEVIEYEWEFTYARW